MGDGAASVESLKSGRLSREGGGHVHEMTNIPSMQSVVRILPIWAGMRAVLECKWAFEFCRDMNGPCPPTVAFSSALVFIALLTKIPHIFIFIYIHYNQFLSN